MRKIFLYLIIFIQIVFLIPILFTKKFETKEIFTKVKNNVTEQIAENNYDYKNYSKIKLLHTSTNEVEEVNLDEYLYHYIIHPSSTMRQSSYTPKLSNIYFVMEQLKNNFQNTKYTEELEFIFIEHLLHGATLRYLDYPEGNNDIKKISNIMKENFRNWEKNKYYKSQSLKYKIICKLTFHKKIGVLKLLLKK